MSKTSMLELVFEPAYPNYQPFNKSRYTDSKKKCFLKFFMAKCFYDDAYRFLNTLGKKYNWALHMHK